MPKPVTPEQVRASTHPGDREAHLRGLVTRRLNRKLKQGSRFVVIPNHISKALAEKIKDEYSSAGWIVSLTDRRKDMTGDAWLFAFKEK